MIKFIWNNTEFDITNLGGGILNQDIPRHSHAAGSYELHFIVGGRGTLVTDDKTYELRKNDFFITGPNVSHRQTTDENERVEDVFMTLQTIDDKRSNAIASVFLDNHFCFFNDFDNTIAKMMLDEYKNKRINYSVAIEGLAIKLLTDISRKLLPDNFRENISALQLNDRRFVFIEQEFIDNKDITLTQLAEKISLCERQTQRLLKKYYGKTFREIKRDYQ